MLADPVKAIMDYLKADADVAQLAGTRVFGIELPDVEADSMPRKAVVVTPSGMSYAPELGSTAAVSSYRFDIWNYGETPFEAMRLRAASYLTLKALAHKTIAGALVQSAIREAGPISIRDAETAWPAAVESFRILAADVSAS